MIRPLTATQWEKLRWELLDRDPRCDYCSTPLDERTATLDHRVPRCKGGASSKANCVLACNNCNQAKGDLDESEFRRQLRFYLKFDRGPARKIRDIRIAEVPFIVLTDGRDRSAEFKQLVEDLLKREGKS